MDIQHQMITCKMLMYKYFVLSYNSKYLY